MEQDLIVAIAHQVGWPLTGALVGGALYRMAPYIGRWFESRGYLRRQRQANQAVSELNGKLVHAMREALDEQMRDAFDERFRDMPEFARNKIKEISKYGASEVLQAFADANFQPAVERLRDGQVATQRRVDQAIALATGMRGELTTLHTEMARLRGVLEGIMLFIENGNNKRLGQ